MKLLHCASLLAGAIALTPSVYAASIITAGVTVTETFGSAPVLADWGSAQLGGSDAPLLTNAAALDNAVNNGANGAAPVAAPFSSGLVTALATTTGYGTNERARWNSTAGTIFTQPTLNYYTGLMATVTNNTGVTLDSLTLTYDLTAIENGSGVGASEDVPGHRVYYSTTGAAGSWQNIATFNGIAGTTSDLSTTLNGLNWTAGTNVYVLWADDNASNVTDDTLALDNVRWNATAVPEPSIALLGGLGVLGLLRRRRA